MPTVLHDRVYAHYAKSATNARYTLWQGADGAAGVRGMGWLAAKFDLLPGSRQIIEVERVMTSCGLAVPLYNFVGHCDTLSKYAETKGDAGMMEYRREKNAFSIDELPTPLGKALARSD